MIIRSTYCIYNVLQFIDSQDFFTFQKQVKVSFFSVSVLGTHVTTIVMFSASARLQV